MPITSSITCPACQEPLVRRPGGRCPHCGADVRAHVQHERERETRLDKVVAVISTALVLGVSLFIGGCSLIQGVLAYAAAGTIMWLVARKTF